MATPDYLKSEEDIPAYLDVKIEEDDEPREDG